MKSLIIHHLRNKSVTKSLIRYLSCEYHEQNRLPKNKKVVICGGGVMGASVAYHLAELGWGPETIVLEKEEYVLFLAYSCPISVQ